MINTQLLKEAQFRLKLTDEALATKAGLGRTRVWQILNGRADDPKLSTLVSLARALELPIEQVIRSTTEVTK